MRKLAVLSLVVLAMSGCSFDNEEHNRWHRKQWDRGLAEFHEDLDFFFLTPR